MGGKGASNYIPIVPKAFVYVPKVMRKPVMGGNTRRKRRLNSALSTAPNMWIEKVTTDKIYKSTWYGIVNNK